MLLDNKLITGALCSLVFCASLFSSQKPHLWILIHGTMASPNHMALYGNKSHWCYPGHKSFEALKKITHASIICCPWSGGIDVSALVAGAKKLIVLLQKHASTHTIHIVAHSNGGNVALLALDLLARNSNRKIVDELILLGTPIYLHRYPESIKAAHRIYNLFSYGDVIQPVFGNYERLLPEQAHIFNIQVTFNGAQALHNQLYKAEIVQLIPHFHKLFEKKGIYCLQCATGKDPIILPDVHRDTDILADKAKTQQLFTSQLKDRASQYEKTARALFSDIRSAIED